MKSPCFIVKSSDCGKIVGQDRELKWAGLVDLAAVLRVAGGSVGECATSGVKAPIETGLLPIEVREGRAMTAAGPTPDPTIGAVPMVPDSIGAGRVVRRATGAAPKVDPRGTLVVRTGRLPTVVQTIGRNAPV